MILNKGDKAGAACTEVSRAISDPVYRPGDRKRIWNPLTTGRTGHRTLLLSLTKDQFFNHGAEEPVPDYADRPLRYGLRYLFGLPPGKEPVRGMSFAGPDARQELQDLSLRTAAGKVLF